MKLNCASCRYYSAKSCHRWPPIGYEDTASPSHAIFPPVALTDWCGEYAELPVDMTMPEPGEVSKAEYSAADSANITHGEATVTYAAGYVVSPHSDKPKRGRPRRG